MKDLKRKILNRVFMNASDAKTANADAIISPEQAWQLIRDGAFVIDCRSAKECEDGMLQEATPIPHNEIADHLENLVAHKGKPVVVYCAVGGRASLVKQALLDAGFGEVYNAGGYSELQASQSE